MKYCASLNFVHYTKVWFKLLCELQTIFETLKKVTIPSYLFIFQIIGYIKSVYAQYIKSIHAFTIWQYKYVLYVFNKILFMYLNAISYNDIKAKFANLIANVSKGMFAKFIVQGVKIC